VSTVAAISVIVPPGLYIKSPVPEVAIPEVLGSKTEAEKTTWPARFNGDGGPEFSAAQVIVVDTEVGAASPGAATFVNPAVGDHR
jgi:hypothetical protein